MNRWDLPGPLRYITSVEKALRDGCSAISATPGHGLSRLGEILRCRLVDNGWAVYGPYPDGPRNPLDLLYESLDVPDNDSNRRSISVILSSMEAGAVVIIDAIRHDRWAEWKIFLVEYEAASRGMSRSERPLLLVVTSSVPLADLGQDGAALRIFPWQNVISEFDVMLFIMAGLRTRERRTRSVRLHARIIARLAMWDLDLAIQLANCDEALLFEPIKALQWAAEASVSDLEMTTNWESGGRMLFDDIQQDHSYLLLADSSNHEKLGLRLWEAQASDLFPLLETKRHELAKQMRPFIRMPIRFEKQIFNEIDEFEIGQLAFLAHSLNLKLPIRKSAETLRRYRNKLAHMEPLTGSETNDILQKIP